MKEFQFERYVVAFEAIDDTVPNQVYHRGEIDFRLFGSDLGWNIKNVLKLIGQPFKPNIQAGVIARPTELWGLKYNRRRKLCLPEVVEKEFKEMDDDRRRRWNLIPVDDELPPH
jgi:hypothetical protein